MGLLTDRPVTVVVEQYEHLAVSPSGTFLWCTNASGDGNDSPGSECFPFTYFYDTAREQIVKINS
jgi:hypothetical protein